MRATNSPRRHPAGFTLVELLVVISIIGILMGLLLGAVQKVREVGKRTTTVSEINQIDMAVTKFKLDFGFNPPHRIRLPGVVPAAVWETSGTPQQKECFAGFKFLVQMFPRWQLAGGYGSAVDVFNNTTNTGTTPTDIKYCSTLAIPTSRSVVVPSDEGLLLEGSQCLVFFLGGPELKGFKPTGPYDPDFYVTPPTPLPPPATSRKGPYFDFASGRLNNSATPTPAIGLLNGYLDPYGVPYAYFSTSGGRGYDPSYFWTPPGVVNVDYAANTPTAAPTAYVMRAYQEATGRPINAGGVQIISAGRNKKFGPGTVGDFTAGKLVPTFTWSAGGKLYSIDGPTEVKPKLPAPGPYFNGDGIGGDDLANFNAGAPLGAAGQ